MFLTYFLSIFLSTSFSDVHVHKGVTAHRGDSGAFPENTIPAFQSAIALKVDWAELDVYRTKDGQLVVIHDAKTGRVAEKDLVVSESNYSELLSLDVASKFRTTHNKTIKECPAQKIPLLEDVLKLFLTQRNTRISIQPKVDCVAEAIQIIRSLNAMHIVGFNDGNLELMSKVNALEPSIPVFWDRPARTDLTNDLAIAKEKGFEALVINSAGITEEKVKAVKAAGLEVGAWTVNDPQEMKTLLGLGIERLYTDYPSTFIKMRRETPRQVPVIKKFPVEKAHQAVAVDEDFFFVINSATITKHRKSDGEQIQSWDGSPAGIKHLNSGVLYKGKLYCANSNFPASPMSSSIEIFDPKTLTPIGSKSLGIDPHGSLTWIDFYDNHWWAGFAQYSGKNMQEGKDNRYTTVVKYDKKWQKKEAWVFPEPVISAFGNYSNSGGAWTNDGRLLCTGHDAAEVYVMKIPKSGYTLELAETISAPGIAGQGIAIDKTVKNQTLLYGIIRSKKEVTVSAVD